MAGHEATTITPQQEPESCAHRIHASQHMRRTVILALDQGTTSSRAALVDRNGAIMALEQEEFAQLYPQPGWVEHDPAAIWQSQRNTIRHLLQGGTAADQVVAISIANQRETVVVWERRSGRPIYPAIVWQCRRTADQCDRLRQAGAAPLLRAKSGLVVDPYFSATKIAWILDHVAGAREAARRSELCAGTIDSWLIWQLSGGQAHVTDYTNASRTQLFNIRTLEWDRELLELFDIPASMLPQVRPSAGLFAQVRLAECGDRALPILGVAGDQQAALYGQGCHQPGEAKNTYGTGCFMLLHTGHDFVTSQHGLLTTLTAESRPGQPSYALEGSVFMGGAIMQWLRDELGLLTSSAAAGPLAASLPDNGGVYLVPAFTGLGAPYWEPRARGTLCGMTRGTGRAHIIRAAEEAIAYQCHDLLAAMLADSSRPLTTLRVDGGAAADDFLMQFQADILNCRLERPATLETTLRGSAMLAAQALGWPAWPPESDGAGQQRSFQPAMAEEQRRQLLAGWQAAVRRSI